jgi:Tol biopolymer transport system component/pimeloyl-ACP methyl ester carboxylesterase
VSIPARPAWPVFLLLSLAWGHGAAADIPPGKELIVEGVPQIPDSLAGQVSRYRKGRTAEILGWHPVRREMLIATFFGDVPQIHLVRFPGGDRTELTFFEDRPTRGVSYQPTRGDYFIFSKDTGGDQNFQNYRYDFGSGAITLLTDGQSKNSPGVWSRAGDRIVYGSTRRTGKDVDLYVMDPLHPQSDRRLAELEGGGWKPLDWSPDDRQFLVLEQISPTESRLWLMDAPTGKRTLFTLPESTQVFYGDACFSRDGKGLYVITDRGSEFQRLGYFDLSTHAFRTITAGSNWDVYEFALSPDGRTLAVVLNEDGLLTLHLIDTRTDKDRQVKHLVGSVLELHWHPNGHDLGFVMDSASSPTDAYSLDVKTGKIERWTESETGGLDTRAFVEPELVRWKSFDGRMVSGFLYRPPARFSGPRPVIVNIHGGPESQFQPYFMGPDNFYPNELGVALLFPNIRGSSGYGKSFQKLDNGFRREDAYKDIGALLDWIRTDKALDANRVMLTGFSYGGNVTLAASYLYADRLRCSIDNVGPSSLVTFLEHTAAYRQDLRRVEYGDERDPKMREFLEGIAPIRHAGRITKPLFVVQGQNDPIVPVSEAEQMVASVRKNGTTVWYLKAMNEGHGFQSRENSDYLFYATVLFIKTYLLN